MNYTKGEWKIHKDKYGAFWVEADNSKVCILLDGARDRLEANAYLIAAAVNACIKLNPDNPMAVAESISDMYEALKRFEQLAIHSGQFTPPDLLVACGNALSKTEGK